MMRLRNTICLAAAVLCGACGDVRAANPGELLWQTPVLGQIYACPTVGPDGMIYVATFTGGGVIYKLDSSGNIVDYNWVRGTVEHSPAMDHDGMLYVVHLSGTLATANPYFGQSRPGASCFRASDLQQMWFKNYSGSDNSPIIGYPQRPNRIYYGKVANPTNPPAFACPNRGFYGLEASTGNIVLDFSTIEGWQACPGVINAGGNLFFGCEDITNYCLGLDPPNPGVPPGLEWGGMFYALAGTDDAAQLWSYDGQHEFGSPVSYADGVVYTTSRDGYLRGFDEADGAVVFQRDLGAPSWCGIAIGIHPTSGRRIYYTGTNNIDLGGGGHNKFYAIEDDGTLAGNLLWQVTVAGGMQFGCAALDDLGNVYFTDGAGILRAYTWDGTPLWQYPLPGGGGIGGPTILNDGTIVSGTNGGYIVAIKGNGNHLNDQVPWPKYKHDLRNTANVLTPIRDLPARPGDLNCDNVVNFSDIDALIVALAGQNAYQAAFPACNWLNGDCDGDGDVNFFDIDPFIDLLGTEYP